MKMKITFLLTVALMVGGPLPAWGQSNASPEAADLILVNGRVATLNQDNRFVSAVAVQKDRILAVGGDQEILKHKGSQTRIIDVKGRTVIPGLIDSHTHLIRAGLNYNLELRWDGVRSLAQALRMVREQAARTPAPHWVRVVGGWSEFQFAERRMPTLKELNEVAPETPVFVLHLYDRALLNRAALKAAGYTKETPDPSGGQIERDAEGNPTGLLVAKPNAYILYSTLNKGPKLSFEDHVNSTQHYMQEMNRLGVTSVIDAGGGFQNYPDDYRVIEYLAKENRLTVRIVYNLFPQRPRHEMEDFTRWVGMARPGQGDDFYRLNGAGEMLVFSAADFEDFLEPRPDLPTEMEGELKDVVRFLVRNRWPFRLHATYGESVSRFLDVLEQVNREVPFDGLRWFFDHVETLSDRDLGRVKALGGGIAIQHRMAFQGEYFVERYGAKAAEQTPPIRRMLEMGVPIGAGTDGTRVATYNPFVSLYWLVSGKTVGGTALYPPSNRLDRMQALRLWTVGSAWFSGEEGKKGALLPGQLADLVVLSGDYFSVPEEQIKDLKSVLTVVGGKVVYGAGEFKSLSLELPPVSPAWSPVAKFGGYGAPGVGGQGIYKF
ncbi:MAG: amidohydrolase [Candidatus Handelsmanbacteria bacterium RIFCSPLOWO2_12_FULL_64_10]|uniref:Amidohydrolase n=1 Tax=Handelsmanbacteria sp. (strain RIFCSPLOWO2_12_FULL_64_10) TaxID=1817868 RepID=A0A1F6C9R0_HANXR|nr:MAG: amidohydrolase [Candidatus Handelsmanbacteria bacterium RIFCSPLOWO2_12_FULL_64_10]